MQLGEIISFSLGKSQIPSDGLSPDPSFQWNPCGKRLAASLQHSRDPLLIQNEEDDRGLKPHSLEGWLGRLEKLGLGGNLWMEMSVGW